MPSPLHVSLSHRWKRSQGVGLAASLTNRLALHLESDFGVTTVSGKVSEWAGMEGFRNTVVQTVDANRPTLVPNVLDGHPAIRFGGTHWLQSLAQVGVVAGDLPRIYVVGSFAATGTSYAGTLASYDNTAVINRGFISFHNVTDQGFNALRGGSLRQVAVTTALGNNSIPHLFDGRNDPTATVLAINGIDRGNFAATGGLDLTPDNINIGRVPSGILALTGDIFCVIVVNNETPNSHQTIMSYLATKYPSLGLGTPKGILGPLYHSDFDVADPGATITAGAVESIPNRGLHPAPMVQATAGLRPTYSATSFPGGGPGATFNGIDQRMTCTFAPAIPSGRRPYLWLVVQPLNASQGNQTACCVTASGGWMLCYARSAPSLTSFSLNMAASGAEQVDFPAASIANSHLMEVGCTTAGTAGAVLDSVAKNFATASGPTLNTALTIQFGSLGGSQFGNCIIRRVILADDLPSQAQIDAMRAYLLAQPYGLIQQKPPLPASAIEYWHSELQCTPSAWVGQIAGTSLTGVGTPVVAADGAFFKGKQVAQTSITGTKIWRNGALPTVAANGSRPWCYSIGRFRGMTGDQNLVAMGRSPGIAEEMTVQWQGTGAGSPQFRCYFNNALFVNNGAGSTSPHRFKTWKDTSNFANFDVDGANVSAASVGPLANDINALAVGAAANGAVQIGDCSVAFWMICSSKPTAAEEAALDAWAQAYWGVP